jgi:hypothetical protein
MLGVLVMLFRLQSDLLSYLWRALIASSSYLTRTRKPLRGGTKVGVHL